jgi:hypothetical protein
MLLINALATLNQILSAGIVITAFAYLLYSLTFNLRERAARAFAALLSFITIVYLCDVVVATLASLTQAEVWLRLQWVGIAFVPVAYLHFSDALLATTGQPSRGRRRLSIRVLYLTAGAFLIAATFTDILVHDGEIANDAAHLRAGPLFVLFIVYFIGSLLWAGWNFLRAYRRCQTSTTRRRMLYLMTSSTAPAVGTFPFLLVAGGTASLHPLIFWSLVLTTNFAVSLLLVVMAYSVAYFGVALPDRIVKARFFQWLLRGPLVGWVVLTVYFVVGRYGPRLPLYDARLLPFFVVFALLLVQFFITLVRLPIERALFYGSDREEVRHLQMLEEHLLTSGDLRQFLESALAGLCDALRVPAAFIAALGPEGKVEYEVTAGAAPSHAETEPPPLPSLRAAPASLVHPNGASAPLGALAGGLFEWGDYWILPLKSQTGDALGLLGLRARPASPHFTVEESAALEVVATRSAAALEDRRLQREVFKALDRLLPQMEVIQRLRASATFASAKALAEADHIIASPDLAQFVRDALSHYWGGPKLTNSPLLRLRIVEQALHEHEGNAANALRAVLQQAIERIKPEGQRKFTGDWLLYNILEMKFLQDRRVREVAMRLAVSEAELYRKQRVALEEVARIISQMEREAAERATDYDIAG